MSLRKLYFFTMLATIVALAAVGRLNRQIKKFDVSTSNSRAHSPALAPDGPLWCRGQPTNKLGRSHWVKAFRAKSEMLPAVFLPVQSNNAKDLGTGRLLVASRGLADPNFAETVVLLVHYLVVHFSGGCQHGFQCGSGFLVVANDSENGAKVGGERACGRRSMGACWSICRREL